MSKFHEKKNLTTAQKNLLKDLLHVAKYGYVEEFKKLVKSRRCFEKEMIDGFDLLHVTCLYGNIRMVNYLLEQGADINHLNNHGRTVFDLIWASGNIDAVDNLYNYASKNNIPIRINSCSTLYASINANVELIKKFISYYPDLGSIFSLELAFFGKRSSDRAHNLFDEYNSKFYYLQDRDLTVSPLFNIISQNNIEVLEYYLKNIDKKGNFQHLALKHINDIRTLEILLSSEIDINKRDKDGFTLLGLALRRYTEYFRPIVELLLKRGASLYNVSNNNQSALDVALTNKNLINNVKVIAILLPHFPDLSTDYINQHNLLHYVCALGDLERIKSYIGKGVDINKISDEQQPHQRKSPLMHPMYSREINEDRKLEVINLLLNEGAKISEQDKEKIREYCLTMGYTKLLKYFLDSKIIQIEDLKIIYKKAINDDVDTSAIINFKSLDFMLKLDNKLLSSYQHYLNCLRFSLGNYYSEIDQKLLDFCLNEIKSKFPENYQLALNYSLYLAFINFKSKDIIKYIISSGADIKSLDQIQAPNSILITSLNNMNNINTSSNENFERILTLIANGYRLSEQEKTSFDFGYENLWMYYKQDILILSSFDENFRNTKINSMPDNAEIKKHEYSICFAYPVIRPITMAILVNEIKYTYNGDTKKYQKYLISTINSSIAFIGTLDQKLIKEEEGRLPSSEEIKTLRKLSLATKDSKIIFKAGDIELIDDVLKIVAENMGTSFAAIEAVNESKIKPDDTPNHDGLAISSSAKRRKIEK